MKYIIFLSFLLFSPLLLKSQWLEEKLYLPDSFGGVHYPLRGVWDSLSDRLYLPALSYSERVLVINCENDEKERPFDAGRQVDGVFFISCFNPQNNCFYLPFSDSLYIFDCQTRQIIKKIALPFPPFLEPFRSPISLIIRYIS